MFNIFDLNKMSTEELIKIGRANRSLLQKRLRRLEENVKKHPGRYSTHGLKQLQGEDGEGIPMVSVKMDRNTLKSNILRLEELKNMKTTTSRGASKHQGQQIRNMLNLPQEGRLNAEQQRQYDQARVFIENDPKIMDNYWKAFEYFQQQMLYMNKDSKQILEHFTEQFSGRITTGTVNNLHQLFNQIETYANEYYEELQKQSDILGDLGREGGWL